MEAEVADPANKPETAWTWVQDRFSEQDQTVMEGYTEDVDSLLVLDGLFSAVVTAFLVISLAMLQPNTNQMSVNLLSTISAQLANASFILAPPYINSTSQTTIVTPTQFHAGVAARWINILWLLSLLFSLASAVFGILVKQWIREYLQWRSPTAAPRKNVVIRQIRFESWKSWRTPIIIASIPALLELAVVLFVGGLTILVWTLDYAVAIVISVFVALFLSLIAFFTLTPAIFKRCPYKSPTSWAFVLLWRLIGDLCSSMGIALRTRLSQGPENVGSPLAFNTHFENAHTLSNADEDCTWRGRDLRGAELATLQDPTGLVVDSRSALLQEFNVETAGILHHLIPHMDGPSHSKTLAPSVADTYLLALRV